MNRLIDWIDDRKTSTYVLAGILIISYGALLLFPSPRLALVASIASIVCPFAIFLVWVVDSALMERLLRRRWTAILIGGVVIAYGMAANAFASDLINGYFKIDPAYFPITSVFLTTVYLLVGIFQPFVMVPLWLLTVISGGMILVVLVALGGGVQSLTRGVLFLVALVLIAISATSLSLLHKNLPILAERVALWADFNEKHRCTADWPIPVDKVIFLHDGNVFAHVSGTRNYEILPCLQPAR